MLKQRLVAIINKLLSPLDAKLVNKKMCEVDMHSALNRIPTHHIINTIIDIGASNGKWLQQAIALYPDAHALAIEPLEEHRITLNKHSLNNPKYHFAICAAGAEDGQTANLAVPEQIDGSAIDGTIGIQRIIPLRTIDSLINEYKLPPPYLIKFDTHGYELPILAGAETTLAQTECVILEVYNFDITPHARRFYEMCSIMEAKGFRCYDLADPMLRLHDKVLWQMDLFFCKTNSHIFEYEGYI